MNKLNIKSIKFSKMKMLISRERCGEGPNGNSCIRLHCGTGVFHLASTNSQGSQLTYIFVQKIKVRYDNLSCLKDEKCIKKFN